MSFFFNNPTAILATGKHCDGVRGMLSEYLAKQQHTSHIINWTLKRGNHPALKKGK